MRCAERPVAKDVRDEGDDVLEEQGDLMPRCGVPPPFRYGVSVLSALLGKGKALSMRVQCSGVTKSGSASGAAARAGKDKDRRTGIRECGVELDSTAGFLPGVPGRLKVRLHPGKHTTPPPLSWSRYSFTPGTSVAASLSSCASPLPSSLRRASRPLIRRRRMRLARSAAASAPMAAPLASTWTAAPAGSPSAARLAASSSPRSATAGAAAIRAGTPSPPFFFLWLIGSYFSYTVGNAGG